MADKAVPPARWYRARWFWYSILCMVCFAAFVFVAELGTREIPDRTMYFLFIWGALPVGLVLLATRKFRVEKSGKGIGFSLTFGILGGIGQWLYFIALEDPMANTAVIAVLTGLYSMITVVLAVIFLRERLNRRQVAGLAFAVAAILIFSLT